MIVIFMPTSVNANPVLLAYLSVCQCHATYQHYRAWRVQHRRPFVGYQDFTDTMYATRHAGLFTPLGIPITPAKSNHLFDLNSHQYL
jgi:hypothetical protein